MSFVDCINNAVRDGSIKEETGKKANDIYERERKRTGDDNAAAMSAVDAVSRLTEDGRIRKMKTLEKAYDLSEMSKDFTSDEFMEALAVGSEKSNISNLQNRQDTNLGILHTKFQAGIDVGGFGFRLRKRKAHHDDVIEELFGGNTGNETAKMVAGAWRETSNLIVKMANDAGANIKQTPNRLLPQQHDPALMMKGSSYEVSRTNWASDHMDAVDWEATTYPDGTTVLPEERLEFLENSFDSIVTGGKNKVKAGKAVKASVATRMSQHRVIHYKDASSWKAINSKYGNGDAFTQMFSELENSARNITSMQILGPDPEAMSGYLSRLMQEKAVAETNAGRNIGKKLPTTKAAETAADFDEILNIFLHGGAAGKQNALVSTFMGIKNFFIGTKLGSTALIAFAGDAMTSYKTLSFNKTGGATYIQNYAKTLNPLNKSHRQLAKQSGLVLNGATNLASSLTRVMGEYTGPKWSNVLTDVTLRATGLTPITEVAKNVFQLEMMGMFHRSKGMSFNDVPFKAMLERYRITPEEWDAFRSMKSKMQDGVGFLRPIDAFEKNEDLFFKFMDMVNGERQYAVIDSNLKTRRITKGASREGTWAWAVTNSSFTLASFPITMLLTHGQRAISQANMRSKVQYMASIVSLLTVAGIAKEQFDSISNGKDPASMNPLTPEGRKTIFSGFMKGGGMGKIADLTFGNFNFYGDSLSDQVAGPVVGFVDDIRSLTLGNLIELAEGKDTNFAKEAASFFGQNMPILSTGFYSKLAFKRMVMDQVNKEVDPKAYQRFRRAERKALRERGQKYWWRAGRSSPDRPPSFGDLF